MTNPPQLLEGTRAFSHFDWPFSIHLVATATGKIQKLGSIVLFCVVTCPARSLTHPLPRLRTLAARQQRATRLLCCCGGGAVVAALDDDARSCRGRERRRKEGETVKSSESAGVVVNISRAPEIRQHRTAARKLRPKCNPTRTGLS